MRRLVVNTFLTLDGVMQAPGGPEEDPSGVFAHGGWSFNYWDDLMYRLWIFPLVLGTGKRLFADGTVPRRLKLADTKTSTTGVVIATYEPAGEVEYGSFALEEPTEAELERRRRLTE